MESDVAISRWLRLKCRLLGHKRVVLEMDPSDQSELHHCVRCRREVWVYTG